MLVPDLNLDSERVTIILGSFPQDSSHNFHSCFLRVFHSSAHAFVCSGVVPANIVSDYNGKIVHLSKLLIVYQQVLIQCYEGFVVCYNIILLNCIVLCPKYFQCSKKFLEICTGNIVLSHLF